MSEEKGENMTGNEKREKYAELMTKLTKATNNEYYYEAIFIEYAVLEDRTDSLLKHAKISCVDKDNKKLTLDKKLRIIKNDKIFKLPYILKHIPAERISEIFAWKKKRNELIHDLVNTSYENNEIKALALDGECIVKNFNNKTKLVNNFLDKSMKK